MSLERIDHRGGRIDLSQLGGGWKAHVYLPGSNIAQRKIPHSMNPAKRQTVINEAMNIIDEYLDGASTK